MYFYLFTEQWKQMKDRANKKSKLNIDKTKIAPAIAIYLHNTMWVKNNWTKPKAEEHKSWK